jgi:hypothetical protein
MSSRLNPITGDIANVSPPNRGTSRSWLRGLYVPTQGYPPNVSAIVLTTKPYLASSIQAQAFMMEPIGPVLVTKGVEVFADVDYHFLQEPAMIEEVEFGNALSRASGAIVGDIDALIAGKEDETKPTEFAYANARRVVESAYGKAFGKAKMPRGIFPKPLVTTDDAGGIRLLWHEGARQIRLNFGASDSRKTYLYFQVEAQHGIDHGVEPLDEDNLATRLAWLTGK